MEFRYRVGGVVACALILTASSVAAQTGERLSDKQVKAIIDEVDTGRDKFEGNLDGSFKGSTLRGPNGEAKVSGALQDYQDGTKKLQHRFTPDYSASAEVATVLKQSFQIDTFMKSPAAPANGRLEWDRQTGNLKRLADAYGTTFPLPDGATVRRVNDTEAAASAGAVVTQAEQVKRAVDADKTLAKPDQKALKTDVEAVIKQAKSLQSRLKDGQPSAADAKALRDKVAALTANGRQLPPSRADGHRRSARAARESRPGVWRRASHHVVGRIAISDATCEGRRFRTDGPISKRWYEPVGRLSNARICWSVKWSGRLDSNQRPPAPKAGALPGCATPRPDGTRPNAALSHGLSKPIGIPHAMMPSA